MKIIEIAFSVYGVTDLPRARRFYEETLGLKPTKTYVKGDLGMVEYDIGAGTLSIGCGAPSALIGEVVPLRDRVATRASWARSSASPRSFRSACCSTAFWIPATS